jgi:hypothetical protein
MCISALVAAASTASVATAVTAASAAISTVAAVQQAQARRAQAEYSAAVARNNAIISAQNEADIIQRGAIARDVLRNRVDQTVGAARAAIAGSGLLLDDAPGTTTSMLTEDLMAAGQFDIMTLRANIDREARRARIQGGEFQAQAGLFDLEASSISPALAGAAAGFSGARSIFATLPDSSPIFSPRSRGGSADLIG